MQAPGVHCVHSTAGRNDSLTRWHTAASLSPKWPILCRVGH